MFDLTGRKALVTGASGGIGGSIARTLHQAGATVAISGTRLAPLEALASELGGRVHIVTADLSKPEEVDGLVGKTEAAMGEVDILINNAGITRDNLFVRMSDADWQAVIDVNLTAPFKLTRAALRGMMKRRFGRVIHISSVVSVIANPGQGNYSAAKAALAGMSRSLAFEIASRGITVNSVAPGFIETPMTGQLNETQRANMLERVPMRRLGTPDEIGAAVLYLASNEAAYVTGQTLHVNGGLAMV
jgi:3-oxoacyl-[acyl-carrier protein] reductase